MSSYWEKLVDLYVDGECSKEERDAIEARAKVDSDTRRAIENAEELRRRLREIPREPPKEFEARLRDAIMNSPAWEALELKSGAAREINAPRLERLWEVARRSVLHPSVVGPVAALLAVVLALVAYFNLSNYNSTKQNAPIALTEQKTDSSEPSSQTAEPWKLIPSPEGNAPESASKLDSQENYWAVVRVDDAEQAKKLKRKLRSQCAELNVSFSKSAEDEQIRLRDVSNEQWLKIAEDWKEPEYERSEALAKWLEGSQEKQTIRVAFKWEQK